MLSYFFVNYVYNIIEYFSYLNLWLIILFLFILLFFFFILSAQLINNSRLCSNILYECLIIIYSFTLIIIVISPALIILLDLEIIIMPTFYIWGNSYQWAWTYTIAYFNWISNCDHYVYSSYYYTFLYNKQAYNYYTFIFHRIYLFYFFSFLYYFYAFYSLGCIILNILFIFIFNFIFIIKLFINYNVMLYFTWIYAIIFYDLFWIKANAIYVKYLFINYNNIIFTSIIVPFTEFANIIAYSFYMFDSNSFIILPLLSTIKYYVFSFDVIHSLGIHSFGIKIDAIPGRFNLTTTIQTLIKGEHRGMCYELCGLGHSTMLIIGLILYFIWLYY